MIDVEIMVNDTNTAVLEAEHNSNQTTFIEGVDKTALAIMDNSKELISPISFANKSTEDKIPCKSKFYTERSFKNHIKKS